MKKIQLVTLVCFSVAKLCLAGNAPELSNGRLDIDASGYYSGEDAGSVELRLAYADAAKTKIQVIAHSTGRRTSNDFSQIYSVQELKSIHVDASGSAGSDGTNGQDGRSGNDGSNGSDGNNGYDGCPPGNGQDGSDGSDGQDGTDGNNGGNGQDGGDGGSIRVYVPANQSELLMLVERTLFSGGSGGDAGHGGAGGRGGDGGRGGSGGRGGDSSCKDDQGNTVGSGGSNGRDGSGGRDGRNGNDGTSGWSGNNGRNGSQSYQLTGSGGGNYSQPLSLQITAARFSDESGDSVLQPGEKLNLLALTIKNPSDMPTTAGQAIRVVFKNSDTLSLVRSVNVVLQQTIPAGGSVTQNFTAGQVVFKASDAQSLGDTATINADIMINAIASSDYMESSFRVSWPLEAKAASAKVEAYFNTALNVDYAVKNSSTQDIGPRGSQLWAAKFAWKSDTIPAADVAIDVAGRNFTLDKEVALTDLTVPAGSVLALPVKLILQNSKKLLTGNGTLSLELYLKDMESGQFIKIGGSSIELRSMVDLRQQLIKLSLDLRRLKVQCHFPNRLVKDPGINKLLLSKVAGSDAVSVQYQTNAIIGNKSPLYAAALRAYTPYSLDLSASAPNAARVAAFLSEVLAPLTSGGNSSDYMTACSVGKQ